MAAGSRSAYRSAAPSAKNTGPMISFRRIVCYNEPHTYKPGRSNTCGKSSADSGGSRRVYSRASTRRLASASLVTGTSMTPFLRHRRDTVYIRGIRHCTQPREGDILLFYRADNKTLILHRICRRYRDGSVLVNGDAQTWTEHVQPAQMLGIVMQISRAGGKPFSANRLDQRILRKLWKWLRPVRPCLFRWVAAIQKRRAGT